MITWPNFVSQLFNGLASGALLALISSGLTIIYGTLGVLNLAHGAMFMLGGYAGYVAFQATGSFVRRGGRRRAVPGRGRRASSSSWSSAISTAARRRTSCWSPSGIGIVIVELVRLGFGSLSKTVPPPAWAAGVTPMGFLIYPTYRIVVAGDRRGGARRVLYVVLYRTRLGMIVRAGIEDSAMVGMLGINVYRVFMLVFGIGAMAAGFAGIVNAPVVSLTPDMGESILVQTLCRRRHRRRRLVSRRDPRRADRRRDPEPDLDGQPGLFAGHAVRGDDPGAAAAAARPARRARAANDRSRRCSAAARFWSRP